ncbi:ADAMTS-like protein 2 isoform X1 [Asterias rubens]|uniref:ADAMTS-like protein 2 isoform X1 n=2 Tax=Asterias rubens TaxID=7604 RepID=UPI001454F078|nr:ADAMTS-like protein 2 isoform X1 [Asterias rubens]XP_033643529.1 ADAMTS-like protein 2 isoform X1 [Asterias rubens]XP_033643530.1 ADAMTS-like protein 2 isoform X1 [Asterias rubens]
MVSTLQIEHGTPLVMVSPTKQCRPLNRTIGTTRPGSRAPFNRLTASRGSLLGHRLIFKWIVIMLHIYFTNGLSELRHQLTDTISEANSTTRLNSYEWSEFGDWSVCSRTCGFGVQSRERMCTNQRNEIADEKLCQGSTRQYKVCKTDVHQCPKEQCSSYNESGLHWTTSVLPVGTCQVVCTTLNNSRRVYRQLRQWMPDGTLCTNYRGCGQQNGADTLSVCLQGHCLGVGCDGVVNSAKAFDACGVCGGDGSTCRVIYATFNGVLHQDYNDVVKIPIGAFNIRVYELQRSGNFLGISDDNGQPLLNSIYSISRPGLYELAGTTVSYKRCGTNADGDYEEIIIKQSLTSNIIILVLNARKQLKAHIAYQYSLPPLERPQTTAASITTSSRQSQTTESKTPSKESAEQDVQNFISTKTLPVEKDNHVDALKQGTSEQQPSLIPGGVALDSFQNVTMETQELETAEPKVQPTRETTSEISKPIRVETTEIVLNETTESPDGASGKLLPASQNSSYHSTVGRVAPHPVDIPPEGYYDDVQHPSNSMLNKEDAETSPNKETETSGFSDDDNLELTTQQNIEFSQNKLLVPENNQSIPEPTAVANNSVRHSPSTVPTYYLENDVFESVYSSYEDYELVTEPTPPTKSFLTASPQPPVTEETIQEAQDIPVDFDLLQDLFGDVPEILALVNSAMESQPSSAFPSAAATSVLISRGDIPRNEDRKPQYRWERTGIAPCSATCSRGMSRSYAYCTLKGQQVADNLCDPGSKPDVVERECEGKPCGQRWAVGSWSHCTVSCGTGVVYRTVHCWLMLAPGLDTSVSNAECDQNNLPESIRPCTLKPCGPQWQTSDWSECSVECGEGLQSREVRCSSGQEQCDPNNVPAQRRRCMIQRCPNKWRATQWNSCPGVCRVRYRRVDCVNAAGIIISQKNCPRDEKLISAQLCGEACPAQWVPQSWSDCQGECGTTTRDRQVVCARTSAVGGHMQVLLESVCASQQKPLLESSCSLVSCQRQRRRVAQWFTTPWSQCSVSCGSGQKSRTVHCQSKRNPNHCNPNKKPVATESCSMRECPATIPACSDSPTADCNLIRRANLCRYASYKRSCCLSCSP